jgi:ribonuclease M5
MKIKEWIVVEGRSDTVTIKRAVEADTIETGGSAIGEAVIERIRLAQEGRGVIIFTDPDYPGERIRRIVSESVPGCKHAFLPREEAIGRHGLGVEHATPESIRHALREVHTVAELPPGEITAQDLWEAELIGGEGSRERREALGKILRIGYANSKQLLKRLNAFAITKEQFREAVQRIELKN